MRCNVVICIKIFPVGCICLLGLMYICVEWIGDR